MCKKKYCNDIYTESNIHHTNQKSSQWKNQNTTQKSDSTTAIQAVPPHIYTTRRKINKLTVKPQTSSGEVKNKTAFAPSPCYGWREPARPVCADMQLYLCYATSFLKHCRLQGGLRWTSSWSGDTSCPVWHYKSGPAGQALCTWPCWHNHGGKGGGEVGKSVHATFVVVVLFKTGSLLTALLHK